MAQYRQSGFDRVYYGSTSTSSNNNNNNANGGNSGDHLAIGMRSTAHKQPRHRRLGHNKTSISGRRISIGTVISLLCFVLAISLFLFFFLSRDHEDINKSNAEDYDFKNDFLANVTRITASQVKFGHGSVAHARDSRYWDGDDRRRDEDYNEDKVSKSGSSSEDEVGKGHVPGRGNSPTKKSNDNMDKHIDRQGLYNEAGRNELKMYEEKYEASLKKVDQSGLQTGEGSHISSDSNSDIEKDETELDGGYENEIGAQEAHIDDYDGNRHENEVNSDLPISHSEGGGDNAVKARDTLETLDEGSSEGGSSEFDSRDNNSGKHSHAAVADGQSKTKTEKRSKKHGRHRSHCEMKLLNSTVQLVEPFESRKFARFSLSYTENEMKADKLDNWEPRFAGHQSLREREDSFIARDQKINCGFVKGPEGDRKSVV